MIPYGRQDISEADIQAVIDVLRSDWITQGPAIERFEESVRSYTGARHAVAVNSATSALHIACLALGLKSGDRLWTSPNTFVASANCALYCGATVDFVDIDPVTYNMSVSELSIKLERAEKEGKLPKIVVPVHFAGQSCDMQAIKGLGDRYGFHIIEDASHAIGGTYEGSPIGGCHYSDITIFSFHPVKIITTGEGGMALTNSAELFGKMQRLRTHGITRDAMQMSREPDGLWYYEQIDLGFNYRITDIQAALGFSQMMRLSEFVSRRTEIADRYNKQLRALPVVTPFQQGTARSAWHLYVILLNQPSRNRKDVFRLLRSKGIGVNVHYFPVHLQPYYRALRFSEGNFPRAEEYYKKAISLPMYPGLTNAEQEFVVSSLAEALQ